MKILTPENVPYDMNTIGGYAPDQFYCSLDLSSLEESDYYFHDLMSVISFSSVLVELDIGGNIIEVPLNSQILIGDEDTGMMEMSSIEDLMTIKEPLAYSLNPIKSLYPRYIPVKINRCYQSTPTKWQMPSLNRKNLLAVPIENKKNPLCIFLADENERITGFYLEE